MTFSIVARDPVTGELGAAVASGVLAIGARALAVEPGLAAVVVQGAAGADQLHAVLDRLREGNEPEEAVRAAGLSAEMQCGVVTPSESTSWTGDACPGAAGGVALPEVAVQGNLLTSTEVWEAARETFHTTTGPLHRRLVASLRAGQQAGGDARGQQSVALVVRAAGGTEPLPLDLRVDDHRDPLRELGRLLDVHHAHDLIASGSSVLHEDIDMARRLVDASARLPGDALLAGWAAVGALVHGLPEAALLVNAARSQTPRFAALCALRASHGGPLAPAWNKLAELG
ncbi:MULTISPECIES: DUF1028 domain-containing protein [Actinoalloteichus]|uniref:DUF1028 domain-containing protein n=1 Tax=Actinoalloteichus TaxID=65496 RepID=UPI00068ACED8|nr:DUF1028 domain-containing protein [Actinoalloteichus caeruleus]